MVHAYTFVINYAPPSINSDYNESHHKHCLLMYTGSTMIPLHFCGSLFISFSASTYILYKYIYIYICILYYKIDTNDNMSARI